MAFGIVLFVIFCLEGVVGLLPSVQVRECAYNNTCVCTTTECAGPPSKKYKVVQNVVPRIQWGDAGGYCGSMSIQEIALGKGAWISQQQVRDHTVDGGGHDHEILETNIGQALKELKLDFVFWDYKNHPTPQADAYRTWIKKQLVAGHGLVWMIMLRGGRYPVYPELKPYGFYSHIEPVYGIYTDHALTDTKWYDDDYLAHSTDADTTTYYRSFKSLPADVDSSDRSLCGSEYRGYPCIYVKWGFGWAITGLHDERPGMKLSLNVNSASEPDVRRGDKPKPFTGKLTIEGLTVGSKYDVYRWNSAEDAFDYSKAKKQHSFTATAALYTWQDSETFMSNSATYYRCLESK